MRPTRRAVIAGAIGALAIPRRARAAWPERPITLVHGFGPGGNADVLARLLSDRLPAGLGQSVVVEARPGAGGTTAALQVSRAAPDGYTLMIVVGGHAVYPAIYKSLAFDPLNGFTFVSMLAEYPFIVATYPGHPVQTPADLIAAARARSEPMTYGTAGIGTTQHLAMEFFTLRSGIRLQHIPYRGSGQGTTDLLAKRIDFMIEAPSSLLPQIQGANLRAIGVTGARRFFALPDVPTLAEGGVAGYDVTSWSGLGGPPNLPAPLVERLNAEVRAVLAEPTVMETIHRIGNEIAPTTPKAFRQRVENDIAKWSEVAKIAKLPQI
jgi:tripartite-type tricarboxylate transporter receptor subunit TctC